MGTSTSKFISDVGSVIGNAVAAPFKSIFSRSCKNECGGMWDFVCFIEHICVLDLIRFLLACFLCYIGLVFLYLVYKLGLCQCLGRILRKMCCTACETYWFTLEYVCCNCWHKIRYTKRVYRGRQRIQRQLKDIELGYISPSSYGVEDFHDEIGSNITVKEKSYREWTKMRRKRRRRRFHGNSVRLRRKRVFTRVNGKSRRF